uniref:Uncharacterized protein n=1 Tax=Cyprinus carpio TaxID=7962 RepID=A0A8C2HCL8_CYPCA
MKDKGGVCEYSFCHSILFGNPSDKKVCNFKEIQRQLRILCLRLCFQALLDVKIYAAVVSVCVMVGLFDTRETANVYPELRAAAGNCEYASRQQSCCCAQMDELEEQMFTRLLNIFSQTTACRGVASTTCMSQMSECFGPFTCDIPFPYSTQYFLSLSLQVNQQSFSEMTVKIYRFPNSRSEGQRLYQRVALVRQGRSEVEDNREDAEDSATKSVLFSLRAAEQVYAQLISGREICGTYGAETS